MANAPPGANDDLIGCDAAGTLPGLFRLRCARTPAAVAYRQFDTAAGLWRDYTWGAMAARAAAFVGAFARAGLERGDRVALALPNGVDWVAFDIAALSLGLITVPLYVHDSAANIALILGHSDARLVLVDAPQRWTALSGAASPLPALEHVWIRNGPAPPAVAGGPRICHLDDALADGADGLTPCPCAPEDVATLIYTSGTTGVPKGVMLSHRAILWNAEAVAPYIPPRPGDVFLSVLPLAHSFERTMGYYVPMMTGSTVAYARSVRSLPNDLETIRPAFLLAVPGLYERMRARIEEAAGGSRVKRWLLETAAAAGWRRFEASHGRAPRPDLVDRALWPLLDRLVIRRIAAALGGRLRVAVSGGAALPLDAARYLIGLGVPLAEGYGLTEAAPVVSATTLEDYVPGSVGRALHGVQVMTGAENELLVRTPAIMKGYWKNPEETARAIAGSGWLHTGDIAEFKEGRIYIRGRIKDVLALSSGRKINPSALEAALKRDPLILQAVIAGENRPFPVAVIEIDDDAFRAAAVKRGVDPEDLENPACKTLVLRAIARCLADFPRYAQPRAVHLTRDPWSVEMGLQTPTLKVRRQMVERRYAAEIAQLYAERAGLASA